MISEQKEDKQSVKVPPKQLDLSNCKVVQSDPLEFGQPDDKSLRHQLFGIGWVQDDQLFAFGRNCNSKLHTSQVQESQHFQRLYCYDLKARKWLSNKYYGSLSQAKRSSFAWNGLCLYTIGKQNLNRKSGHRTYGRVVFGTDTYRFTHWGSSTKAPVPRCCALFQSIKDYFVLYGGFTGDQHQEILLDAFVFKDDEWCSLKIKNSGTGVDANSGNGNGNSSNQPQTQYFSSTVCGERIFIFGGRHKSLANSPLTYSNDITELCLSQKLNSCRFKAIEPKNKSAPKPSKRCKQAMSSISSRCIVIAGGQNPSSISNSSQKNSHSKPNPKANSQILQDIWVFDLYDLEWNQVRLTNPLPKRFYTMLFHKNELILFGGYINIEASKDNKQQKQQKDCIWLAQFDKLSAYKITKNQQNQQRHQNSLSSTLTLTQIKATTTITTQPQQQQPQHSQSLLKMQINNFNNNTTSNNNDDENDDQQKQQFLQVSGGLIFEASIGIKFVFHAFQRIIIFLEQYLNSKNIKIYADTTDNMIDQYSFLTLEFDGDFMHPLQFLECSEADTIDNDQSRKKLLQFNYLKLYGLRMGKCMLFVQNKGNIRNVKFVSTNPKITPSLQKQYVIYQYSQKIDLNIIWPFRSGQKDKAMIHNALKMFLKNPQTFINEVSQSKIVIFQLNIFLTSQKNYYYQLIFPKLEICDVCLYKSENRDQFLQKCKYQVQSCMDFSLNRYLQFAMAGKQPKAKVFLNKCKIPLQRSQSYAANLAKYQALGRIIPLTIKPIKYVQRATLFQCKPEYILNINNGILLFQNGHLINRMDCYFGDLMTDKFYKKRYRSKGHNVFQTVGQIHFSKEIKLINFKTDFAQTNIYAQTYISLVKAIDRAIEQAQDILNRSNQQQQQQQLPKSKNNQINSQETPIITQQHGGKRIKPNTTE